MNKESQAIIEALTRSGKNGVALGRSALAVEAGLTPPSGRETKKVNVLLPELIKQRLVCHSVLDKNKFTLPQFVDLAGMDPNFGEIVIRGRRKKRDVAPQVSGMELRFRFSMDDTTLTEQRLRSLTDYARQIGIRIVESGVDY